jgi:phosphoribosylglycinamide formyltransferase-1
MSSRIAILASGAGTTAQSLLDAGRSGHLGEAEVVVLVSDRPNAPALERARKAGVEALFVDASEYPDRVSYSEALAKELQRRDVDLVCFAGFMKILSPPFIRAFPNRILNTHAALLPAFPGAHPVRDSLEWGVKVTGATIHLVDEEVDHGPIVLQEAVPVLPTDNEEALHERIKQLERRLYPEAVRAMVSGRVRIVGRKVLVGSGR